MDDLHLKVTRAFNLELPAGANGDSPYTYTVSALPSGLDFDDQTRFISGTPDTPGMTNVTYTVTDDDGDPISTDFKATVYPMPSLIDVSDISIVQGRFVHSGASRGYWRQTSVRLLRDRSAERSAHRAPIHRVHANHHRHSHNC